LRRKIIMTEQSRPISEARRREQVDLLIGGDAAFSAASPNPIVEAAIGRRILPPKLGYEALVPLHEVKHPKLKPALPWCRGLLWLLIWTPQIV
jgi:hypothetical protein